MDREKQGACDAGYVIGLYALSSYHAMQLSCRGEFNKQEK